jgi:hypothetical protein
MIRFSAIDTETRSLVESLLKAQKEEEWKRHHVNAHYVA